MKVTILIPSWNSALYIERALRSVLAGGWDDFEILVMDNESTDGTDKVIEKVGDSRVRYIAEKDGGMYEALNRGIKQSTGEIMCWLGADDQHDKLALQKVMAVFENPKVQWITGEGTFLFEGGKAETTTRYHHLPPEVTLKEIAFANPLISPSVFFRKSFFEQAGGFSEKYKYAADYDLWLRFARAENPYVLRESLSIFSFNGDNISSKSKIKMYQETLDILHRADRSGIPLERYSNILRMHAYILYNRLKQLGK